MKIIENLLIWMVIFLPAIIWWVKSSDDQLNSMHSWADCIACFIMWGITIIVIGSAIVFLLLIISAGGSFTFVF